MTSVLQVEIGTSEASTHRKVTHFCALALVCLLGLRTLVRTNVRALMLAYYLMLVH